MKTFKIKKKLYIIFTGTNMCAASCPFYKQIHYNYNAIITQEVCVWNFMLWGETKDVPHFEWWSQ